MDSEQTLCCKYLLIKCLKQMNNQNNEKKANLINFRKDQILAAAKRIFAQKGFRRTKIDEIAEYLNLGKGTLYRYFKDKKSLFLAIFEQGLSELRQTIFDNVEPITDPRERIVAAVKTYFSFFDNDREHIEIMMQVRSEFKEDYWRISMAVYSDYIVRIQENLRKGIKIGVFRELDIEKTAEAISATLQGTLQGFYVREFAADSAVPDDKSAAGSASQKQLLTDRTEAVTKLLLSGLLKPELAKDFL